MLDNSPLDGNGCPVKYTLFFHGGNARFDLVDNIVATGGEVGSHTATHNTGLSTTKQEWSNQMSVSKGCLSRLVHNSSQIIGFRAPFLEWNSAEIEALSANDFVYDSSMICNYEQMNGWPWPFSITYGIPQLSSYRTAVTSINNSIWEFPLYAPLNKTSNSSEECMDYIPLDNWSADEILEMYKASFLKHYNSNKAPYGVYWHPDGL